MMVLVVSLLNSVGESMLYLNVDVYNYLGNRFGTSLYLMPFCVHCMFYFVGLPSILMLALR